MLMGGAMDELLQIVSKVAPLVGGMLGTPMASIAISLLSHIFGGNGNDIANLLSKIKSDPESELKLKTLEYQHQEALQQFNLTQRSDEISDNKSARDLAEKLDNHFWILPTLSIFFIMGFFIFIYLMLGKYFSSSDDVHRIFDILSNSLMLILAFWFGSCHGNK